MGQPQLLMVWLKGTLKYKNEILYWEVNNLATLQVVRTFLTAGVAPSQIGIICLFRAQVSMLRCVFGNISCYKWHSGPCHFNHVHQLILL